MLRAVIVSGTFCVFAGVANADSFLGVFTTPFVPGCTIESGGSYIGTSHYGLARSGGDFGHGLTSQTASKIFMLDDDLKDQAKAAGFNAVIGFKVAVDHSNDAVFESGTNWNADGKPFDFIGTFIVLGTGTPVVANCP